MDGHPVRSTHPLGTYLVGGWWVVVGPGWFVGRGVGGRFDWRLDGGGGRVGRRVARFGHLQTLGDRLKGRAHGCRHFTSTSPLTITLPSTSHYLQQNTYFQVFSFKQIRKLVHLRCYRNILIFRVKIFHLIFQKWWMRTLKFSYQLLKFRIFLNTYSSKLNKYCKFQIIFKIEDTSL